MQFGGIEKELRRLKKENFSVLKSAPAKACSKKCTAGSNVSGLDHSRLVDVVLGEAPALKGALASLPSPSWTIYKYVYIYVELIYNTVLAFKKAQYVYMC